MTLGERIKRVRRTLDLTQQEFGTRLGLKRNSISLIESGRNTSDQTIFAICREFHVNEEWIRTGEGEMFTPAASYALDRLAEDYNLSHGDYVFIEKFLKINAEGRRVIMDFMMEFAEAIRSDDISMGEPAISKLSKKETKNLDAVLTEIDIEEEVSHFRAQLEAQKKEEDESSASGGTSAVG